MANLLGGVIHQWGIIIVPPTLCQSCRGGLINAEARSQTCVPCMTSLTVVDAPPAFFQFLFSSKTPVKNSVSCMNYLLYSK